MCVLCQSIQQISRLTITRPGQPKSKSDKSVSCTIMIHRIKSVNQSMNRHVKYPDPASHIYRHPTEPNRPYHTSQSRQISVLASLLLSPFGSKLIKGAETRTPFVKYPCLFNLGSTVFSFVISRISFAVLDLDTVWMN